MRILMLLSQTEITGAEVHAAQLGEELQKQGHKVFLMSDSLNVKSDLEYIQRFIHPKGFFHRLANILFLRRWLKEQRIEIVHAHSRAAVRVAYWACFARRTSLVATVHGRQHFSWSKRIFNLYGRYIIAVCENIRQHLINDFKLSPFWISNIPNPLHEERLSFVESLISQKRFAIIGRTSGPKGEKTKFIIHHILPGLIKKFPDLQLHLWGGPLENLGADTQDLIHSLNKEHPGCIEYKGSGDLNQVMEDYQLIIGAGRVAIAALMRGVPLFALGEAKSEGFVNKDNFAEASKSNFGDIDLQKERSSLNATQLSTELEHFFSQEVPNSKERHGLSELARSVYNFNSITERVLNIYRASLLGKHHPKSIPILMYHLVSPQAVDTSHRIFVTSETFNHQIHKLKAWGFSAINFQDILDFTEGRRPWKDFPSKPVIISFDDGYKNNLTEALPILKKYNFKAVIYLLANHEDQANDWDAGEVPSAPLLTATDRQELMQSGFFEIGSHGLKHRPLTELNLDEAKAELTLSKEFLEKEFKTNIHSYAFTYGKRRDDLAALAHQVGYKFIINTDQGGFHLSQNFSTIFRTPIFPEDRGFKFWRKVQPWYRRYFYWTRKK